MAMNQTIQQRFMYLFERVGEPLYFGPRGETNVYYMVPTDNLDDKTKHAATEFRRNVGVSGGLSVDVKTPARRPDLSSISLACPRTTLFSYFIKSHRDAAAQLRRIMLDQASQEDFLSMACVCRDSEMVNPRLWIYAFATACLQRPDLKGFKMPAIWEVMPDQFVGPNVVRMAQRQSVLPQQDRSRIIIPRNNTGDDSNPENLLAYFREDMGVNSHHWHWHLVYPLDAAPGQRDRKGELFYWMHHDLMARYDAERLANGLGRTKPHDLSESIPEGYFPKLYNTNSGIIWGTRQEGSRAGGVDRLSDTRFPVKLDWEEMKKWRSRISEAIDTGVIMRANGQTERLSVERGIDVLGDLLEASDYSANQRFYGDFHNMGHVAIAFAHDPFYRHREEMAVMGDSTTAMRDPVFYRWHKYIDEIFDKYKATLPPYTVQELAWAGIRITELSVQIEGRNRDRNILATSWMQSDIDLARGLDFGRTNANNLGPVWATVTHLNHENFAYRIVVQNTGREQVSGTVRIFMAPRLTENRRQFDMSQQRLQYMAMDKFTTVLRPGENIIVRQSTESTVTIPWEQTFRDLERTSAAPGAADSICGCGWPQHLLVPRGTTDGMLFDLYAIITNGAQDLVPRRNAQSTEGTRRGCRDAAIYCGLLDERYPDSKPMGFPFDRYPRLVNNRPIANIEAFVADVPNSRTTQIRIVHRDVTIVRSGGAPQTMPMITMGTPKPSPVGSPSSSRSPSPTTNRPTSPTPGSGSGKQGRGRESQPGRNPGWGGGGRGGGGGYGNWKNNSNDEEEHDHDRWDKPYQGYNRHHDHSPTGRRGWPRGWAGDE